MVIGKSGWLGLLVWVALAAAIQLPLSLNHDAAWHFQTSFRVLAGERLGAGVWVDGRLLTGAHGGAGEMVAFDHVRGVGSAWGFGHRAVELAREARAAGTLPAEVTLADFTPGADKIDFREFDGNNMRKGNQPLQVVEYVQYTDGQSDLEQGFVNDLTPGGITIYEDELGDTWLIINRDNDRNREFVIHFDGALGDFSADLLL